MTSDVLINLATASYGSEAERVFEAECRAYPKAIRALARGQVVWENGTVKISEENRS